MFLKDIAFSRFRNLKPLTFVPNSRVNIFFGDNAQGKSNILEGIDLLTNLESFRSAKLAEMIQFGQDSAILSGDLEQGGIQRKIDIILREKNRQVKVDGTTLRSKAQFFQYARALTFTSEDLRILTGSPGSRRTFLDKAVCIVTPNLSLILQSYKRTISQKNALLAKNRSKPDPSLIFAWNQKIVSLGARLIAARVRYLRYITTSFSESFQRISDVNLPVHLGYVSEDVDVSGDVQIANVEEQLAEEMERRYDEELRRGFSLVGPHRHDFIVHIGGHKAARFASQGQLRMLALSLKLAELTVITEKLDVLPVFLLDDVSSELDERRNRCLMEVLQEVACQTFITTTSLDNLHLPDSAEATRFLIEDGEVFPL